MDITKYNDDQPRDEQGRFGSGGGSGGGGGSGKGGSSSGGGAGKKDSAFAATRQAQAISSTIKPGQGTAAQHNEAAAAHRAAAAAHGEAGNEPPHGSAKANHEAKAKEHETIARMFPDKPGGDGGGGAPEKDKRVGADRYTTEDMTRNGGIALTRMYPDMSPAEHELQARMTRDKGGAAAHMEAARIKRERANQGKTQDALTNILGPTNHAARDSARAQNTRAQNVGQRLREVAARPKGPSAAEMQSTHNSPDHSARDAERGKVFSERDAPKGPHPDRDPFGTKKVAPLDFFYSGPQSPAVLFVIDGPPTLEERLRMEPLVNEDGERFSKRYLAPLGLTREHVGVLWTTEWFEDDELRAEAISKIEPEAIVLLSNQNRRSRGIRDGACELPSCVRGREVWKASHKEEIERKLKAVRKNLDARATSLRPCLRPLLKAARPHDGDEGIANATVARLYKADEPKRIVYGVVLDPYQVDLQKDWVPAAEIEATAHEFISKRGYVSDRHEKEAPDSQVVESFVEPYPSDDDYRKAMQNLPHRAYRRKFGSDVIHSGAWVLGVKLSPQLWSDYQAGKLGAFSIEGFGTREDMESSEMPQVTFVDVERK